MFTGISLPLERLPPVVCSQFGAVKSFWLLCSLPTIIAAFSFRYRRKIYNEEF
jgi:hypothetical protein